MTAETGTEDGETSMGTSADESDDVVIGGVIVDEGSLLPIAFLMPYDGTVSPGFV